MSDRLSQLVASFDGLGVIVRFDRPTGSWIFISLHDDRLGRMTGGSRMRIYEDPADGLLDSMRLARGMTSKWAALDMPFGGAKAVLAIDHPLEGDERRGFLERYGRLIDSLGGIFSTGEDLGTTPEDFAVIARQTRHIHGFDPDSGQKIDPGPFTARGVFAGMRAAAEEVFGGGLADRVVLIQGVGHVGRRLAEMLRREGARVLLCDIDEELARRVAEEIGGETVRADRVYDTPCDIYSPCAIGSTLNEETIPRLSCRLVAGSANNQLATEADADRLHRREIVYAPDFVINGGGAMAFGLLANGETDTAAILQRMDDVGSTIGEIFREASANDESPLDAANRRVRRVLERGA